MFRAGMCVVAGGLVSVATWTAAVHFTPVEGAPAADAKAVDLTALREAVETAAKKGENVEEIRTALEAFAKTKPAPTGRRVPPELQALRDAVDAAARKGENVEAISKELLAVEMGVAGKALAKPRPQPQPQPELPLRPNPGFPAFPNPPAFPAPGLGGGGIDVEMFNKAMELRRKAVELMLKNPNDPEVIKEAQKLQAEAADLLLKAARNLGGPGVAMPAFPGLQGFPDIDRVPDRARLGIRMDKVPAIAAEQLGLEPNAGIAIVLVMPGSAAEKAGLKVHDIVLEFAGKAVSDNTEDFARRVNDVKAGEKVDLVVLRKGKKVEVKGVELAKPIRASASAVPGAAPAGAPERAQPGETAPAGAGGAPGEPRGAAGEAAAAAGGGGSSGAEPAPAPAMTRFRDSPARGGSP